MSTKDIYLGVFLSNKASPRWQAWFEGHPHFTIFPCDAVDVMPLLSAASA